MGYLRYIDTSGRHISSYKYLDISGTESLKCILTLSLGLVAMDSHGFNAQLSEISHKMVSSVLGSGEDDRLFDIILLQEVAKHYLLVVLLQKTDLLVHCLSRACGRRDLYGFRIMQYVLCQCLDFLWHGGRKHYRLSFFGYLCYHLTDVMDEAHVQHSVSLIKNKYLDVPEAHNTLIHVVQETAGGCHQNVTASFISTDLGALLCTTVETYGMKSHVSAILFEILKDLYSQLSCGCEYKGAGMRAGFIVEHI